MKWKTSTTVFVVTAFIAAIIVAWHWLDFPSAVSTPAAADVIVYKDPNCGCCNKWVEHLREHGFNVTAQNDVRVDKIKRLLRERPAIKGIAVAGMPAGSPGMEGPYHESYNVMSFDASGQTEIYERH